VTAATEPQIITEPAFEATHYGIPVCHIGEDGDMLALGHPGPRHAFAAFNRHARVFVGLDNLADDRRALLSDWFDHVEEKWVIFRKPDAEQGEDPDYVWVFDTSAEGEPGAQPVTLLDVC
jgi:hypothetical protein